MSLHCIRLGILLLGMLVTTSAWAGMTREITLSSAYNNNVLRDANSMGDYITQVKGMMGWHWRTARSQTQFYYSGTGYLFADIGSRSFLLNGAGFAYTRKFVGGKSLQFNSFASLRTDRSDFNNFDNVGWQSYISYKMRLPRSMAFSASYSLQLRRYWHMRVSRYAEQVLSTQLTKHFSTRTWIRGDLGYGYKQHADTEGQMIVGVEAGQPLAQNTNLHVRYERRWNTQADVFDEDLLAQDIDMMYNRYDYNGQTWSAKLSQQLPNRRVLTLSGGLHVRHYQTLTTLAWQGVPLFADELRKDRNPYISVAFQTPISNRVMATFVYDFESNQSNDTFYNFKKRNNLSVDLGMTF